MRNFMIVPIFSDGQKSPYVQLSNGNWSSHYLASSKLTCVDMKTPSCRFILETEGFPYVSIVWRLISFQYLEEQIPGKKKLYSSSPWPLPSSIAHGALHPSPAVIPSSAPPRNRLVPRQRPVWRRERGNGPSCISCHLAMGEGFKKTKWWFK